MNKIIPPRDNIAFSLDVLREKRLFPKCRTMISDFCIVVRKSKKSNVIYTHTRKHTLMHHSALDPRAHRRVHVCTPSLSTRDFPCSQTTSKSRNITVKLHNRRARVRGTRGDGAHGTLRRSRPMKSAVLFLRIQRPALRWEQAFNLHKP